jgi:hypothetical protein
MFDVITDKLLKYVGDVGLLFSILK